MKKLLVIISAIVIGNTYVYAESPNPIVERLSQQEIEDCKTPASIAYNFMMSILEKDFDKMQSYMSQDGIDYLDYIVNQVGATSYEQLLSEIASVWLSAVNNGEYEVVVGYVQDLWYYREDGDSKSLYRHMNQVVIDGMVYIPDEDIYYEGVNKKKVYVLCSPSSQIDNNVGFQDIYTLHDAEVILGKDANGEWKVDGID